MDMLIYWKTALGLVFGVDIVLDVVGVTYHDMCLMPLTHKRKCLIIVLILVHCGST